MIRTPLILLVMTFTTEVLAQDRERDDARMYITAVQEKLSGNYVKATEIFEAYLQQHPKSADACYNLAAIYDAQGRIPRALEMSEKACKTDSKNKWYLLQRAYLLQRDNNYREAVKIYDKLLKLEPRNPEFYFSKSEAYLKGNDLKNAIKTLDAARHVLGEMPEIAFQKYRMYAMAEKFSEAAAELEKLLATDTTDVRVMGMLGELYEHMGQQAKAFNCYQRILKHEPDNGVVHLSLAQYYLGQHDERKATEEIIQAMQSPKVDIDTKMRILIDYFERTEHDKRLLPDAYRMLDLLVQTHPADAKGYSMYGDYLYRDDKLKEARDMYLQSVTLDKSRFPLWNQLILLDARLDDRELLYAHTLEAKELFPSQPGFFFYHGLACNQLKKYDEAIASLQQAENLVVDNNQLLNDIYQGLGEAWHYRKDYSKSDSYYEKALAIDGSSVYALNNFAYYLSLRNTELEKAARMAKKCNEIQPGNPSFEDTYGYILFLQKKYTEAEVWIKKSLQHGGDQSGTVLEHYGDVMMQLNRLTEAKSYWQKALETGEHSNKLTEKIKSGKYIE